MMRIFGDIFDFNHDGQLDSFVKAAEFTAFASMMDAGLNPDEFDF